MRYRLLIILTFFAIITLTCKVNVAKLATLEQKLKEIELATVKQTQESQTETIRMAIQEKIANQTTATLLNKIQSSIKEKKQQTQDLIQKEQDLKKEIEDITKQDEEQSQQTQSKIELDQAKIALKQKIQDIQKLLIIHKNNYYNEPINQFGMHDNEHYNKNNLNKAFDVIETQNLPYSHPQNKKNRNKIYLIFEYNNTHIESLGKILNKITKDTFIKHTLKPNTKLQTSSKDERIQKIIQNIIHNINEYFNLYFNNAFNISEENQKKLNSLTINDIQTLNNIFDERKTIGNTCKEYASKIYNDFQNDEGMIKTGDIEKLIDYIKNNEYNTKFTNQFKKLEKLITQIKNIIK
ncbi:CRASP family complement regulator-acquiring lipoprotein [Borrelia persica]|uniref:CRASP family complement regulator-acquiring lipoprotein n=1 Tax=Borrelia persica TaxID=44448 RepID=UPI000467ECBC|nr:CRASP family complement regulator-acquiring lipoprotein [Borrelia persica]